MEYNANFTFNLISILKNIIRLKYQLLSLTFLPIIIYLFYMYYAHGVNVYNKKVYEIRISRLTDLELLPYSRFNDYILYAPEYLTIRKLNLISPITKEKFDSEYFYEMYNQNFYTKNFKKKLLKELEKKSKGIDLKIKNIFPNINFLSHKNNKFLDNSEIIFEINGDNNLDNNQIIEVFKIIELCLNSMVRDLITGNIIKNFQSFDEIQNFEYKQLTKIEEDLKSKFLNSNNKEQKLLEFINELAWKKKLINFNKNYNEIIKRTIFDTDLFKSNNPKIVNYKFLGSKNRILINNLKNIFIIITLSLLSALTYFIINYSEKPVKKK